MKNLNSILGKLDVSHIRVDYVKGTDFKRAFGPAWTKCNETYSDGLMREIQSLNDIERAVFLCGDGDHVLSLSSILEGRNYLHRIDVVDISDEQLTLFTEKIDRMKKSRDLRGPVMPGQGDEPPLRGRFAYDTTFHLYKRDITTHIENLSKGGARVYYIYLSNALFNSMWMGDAASSKLISKIETSHAFKEGTIIHMQYSLSSPIILKKESGRLKQIWHDGPDATSESACKSARIMERLQNGQYRVSAVSISTQVVYINGCIHPAFYRTGSKERLAENVRNAPETALL